jgi:toxin ParE1/3/4
MEDLADAYLHIAADSGPAAERLLDAADDAVRFLLAHPGAGKRRDFRSTAARGVRSWPVRGFESYLIFYRLDADGIEVVRFVHGARDIPRTLEDES